jgi:hypothetical protein
VGGMGSAWCNLGILSGCRRKNQTSVEMAGHKTLQLHFDISQHSDKRMNIKKIPEDY